MVLSTTSGTIGHKFIKTSLDLLLTPPPVTPYLLWGFAALLEVHRFLVRWWDKKRLKYMYFFKLDILFTLLPHLLSAVHSDFEFCPRFCRVLSSLGCSVPSRVERLGEDLVRRIRPRVEPRSSVSFQLNFPTKKFKFWKTVKMQSFYSFLECLWPKHFDTPFSHYLASNLSFKINKRNKDHGKKLNYAVKTKIFVLNLKDNLNLHLFICSFKKITWMFVTCPNNLAMLSLAFPLRALYLAISNCLAIRSWWARLLDSLKIGGTVPSPSSCKTWDMKSGSILADLDYPLREIVKVKHRRPNFYD